MILNLGGAEAGMKYMDVTTQSADDNDDFHDFGDVDQEVDRQRLTKIVAKFELHRNRKLIPQTESRLKSFWRGWFIR